MLHNILQYDLQENKIEFSVIVCWLSHCHNLADYSHRIKIPHSFNNILDSLISSTKIQVLLLYKNIPLKIA